MDTQEREKILAMEKAIRESISFVCPDERKTYIRGYLEGRLNAVLIIERDLLGEKIDFPREP